MSGPANPTDRRYTNDHEWAHKEGTRVTVGITHYAQDSLGDVVYVELPKVGDTVEKGRPFGVVESTKAVSELFAPVSGTVVEVNGPLVDAPDTVNSDPFGKGWMVRIEPADASEFDALLTPQQYEAFLAGGGH
jgi:glycine cleavage system H protein